MVDEISSRDLVRSHESTSGVRPWDNVVRSQLRLTRTPRTDIDMTVVINEFSGHYTVNTTPRGSQELPSTVRSGLNNTPFLAINGSITAWEWSCGSAVSGCEGDPLEVSALGGRPFMVRSPGRPPAPGGFQGPRYPTSLRYIFNT